MSSERREPLRGRSAQRCGPQALGSPSPLVVDMDGLTQPVAPLATCAEIATIPVDGETATSMSVNGGRLYLTTNTNRLIAYAPT